MNPFDLVLTSLGWILLGLIWLVVVLIVVAVIVGIIGAIRKPRRNKTHRIYDSRSKTND